MIFDQNKYNEALKVAFQGEFVDFEVPDTWYEWALKAMKFASPIGLGVRAEEMLELYDIIVNKKPINYYQYALISNNLENRSANDLGLDFKVYAELMMFIGGLTEKWNSSTRMIQAKVFQRESQPKKN